MHRPFLSIGFVLGFLGVAAGAFGAHALGESLDADRVGTFETAVRYQLVHALALIGVGLAAARWPDRGWAIAGGLIAAGTLIFSGSLYAMSLTDIGAFGAVAPVGGVSLLCGWFWGWRTAARRTS